MTRLAFDSQPASPFRARLHDVFSAAAPSVLTVSFGLSYAVLIFGGPLAPYLPYGIAATFIGTAALATVVAFGSSFRFAIGAPETSTAAVTAVLTSSVVEHLQNIDPAAPLLAPVLITLAIGTMLTGLALCGLGLTRIGRAVRYVPYPVVGGFLGATACLIAAGGIKVITGHRLMSEIVSGLGEPQVVYQLLAGLILAGAIFLIWHRSRNPLALPAILLSSVIVAHVWVGLAGLTVAQAQALGWTFATPPPAHLVLPWSLADLGAYPWGILPQLLGNIVAVIFVATMSTLFNITGIEIVTHREADLERELRTAGLANLLSGALGGYAGCISLSRTVLNYNNGARTRLSGCTVAAVAVLALIADPSLLAFVPKFVLGGLLLYLGLDQLNRWIVVSRRRLSLTEYLSLLAIIVIIVKWGFIAGVSIGVVIGCATFALSASRVNAIKYGFDGSEYRSSLDRSRDDLALLASHGHAIHGLNLQSYLFFGSANRLYQHVKALLQRHPECRYLVFDFKLVTGFDSSAAYSFAQIKQAAQERGTTLLLVHLSPAAEKTLRASGFITPDVRLMRELDDALEWCENKIISGHRGLKQEEIDLRGWFTSILGNRNDADALIHRCVRTEVHAGEIIARAGEPANTVLFILNGRVGVTVKSGEGRDIRVRSLGRHTTVGEMGLVARQPRSATIQAETESVLYVLNASAFEELTADNPALGQKLLTYFMSVMAERLSFATRMIGVLRR